MTRPFIYSVSLMGIVLAGSAIAGSPVARAADAEAVTIDTTFTVMTPPVRLNSPAPTAHSSVILMAGGKLAAEPRCDRHNHKFNRQLSNPVRQPLSAQWR